MNTNTIGHQAIAASAGSGKTFQLAHRFIRLMAGGVRPERIIALTFSRKAAGEIFDSIIKYLHQAASSPEKASQTAELIGSPQFGQGDFLRLLRELLNSLHRLHVGTLDSFTIGVIRTFPMELGISNLSQVMESDGAQAKTARQEILARIFNNRQVDRSAQREFLEAFKQATYGKEEKSLERSLDTFIGEYREYYQLMSSPDMWGNQDHIWSEGSIWLDSPQDVKVTADTLEDLLAQQGLPDKIMYRWHTFLDAVRDFNVNAPWTRDIEYLTEKLLCDVGCLREGSATLKIDRAECVLSSEASYLALNLLTLVMQTELKSALQKTQGIYRVLDQYEQSYEEMIRRHGKMTFSDAQYLLTPANSDSGGSLISRLPEANSRLYIDYRLDCKLDHWLLDEFQDTSDLQWEALSNLADEILQDVSGQRSFFYVGDVKQAIYGWRGGNARLFGKILEHYGDLIEQRPMNTSFRSCQPIIDTVNRVFTTLPHELPPGAIAEWQHVWQEHQCQRDAVPRAGYVALIEPPCNGGEVKPNDEDRYRVVARLLREIDPINRGLSTAILMRSNENGKRIVNILRQECPGVQIIHEGKASIKDNPVISALLSLVKFAAHPGDTFAWRHLQMSPLNQYLEQEKLDRNHLSVQLLREIQQGGFKELIRTWGTRLNAIQQLDAFGQMRLENLINAAAEFDSTSGHDCNLFLHFIDNFQIHEFAADDAVRVMTIHQSKGLGFDIVILPDLQGRGITDSGDSGFTIARDSITNHPLWALRMPRRLVAENDPVLASQLQLADEAACFDALCVLYVALTRAKQGLYVITGFPGKSARTLTSAIFLKTQLCGESKTKEGPTIRIDSEDSTCLYEAGERQWYQRVTPIQAIAAAAEQDVLSQDFIKRPSIRRRLVQVSPSEQTDHKQRASDLFSDKYYDSLEFGKVMHRLLAKIKWIEETNAGELLDEWEKESSANDDFKHLVSEHFMKALASDEIRKVLSRPEGNIQLWREKPFEIILNDQWITGSFDRVVIIRNADGRTLRASILDFKSDDVAVDSDLPNLAHRYRPQLSLYQRALSQMLAIDLSQIELSLVFTHPSTVHTLQ